MRIYGGSQFDRSRENSNDCDDLLHFDPRSIDTRRTWHSISMANSSHDNVKIPCMMVYLLTSTSHVVHVHYMTSSWSRGGRSTVCRSTKRHQSMTIESRETCELLLTAENYDPIGIESSRFGILPSILLGTKGKFSK